MPLPGAIAGVLIQGNYWKLLWKERLLREHLIGKLGRKMDRYRPPIPVSIISQWRASLAASRLDTSLLYKVPAPAMICETQLRFSVGSFDYCDE